MNAPTPAGPGEVLFFRALGVVLLLLLVGFGSAGVFAVWRSLLVGGCAA